MCTQHWGSVHAPVPLEPGLFQIPQEYLFPAFHSKSHRSIYFSPVSNVIPRTTRTSALYLSTTKAPA